ncbi:sensor histidine kinase [Synechococcus sp. BDU 130192]|uniref:sensor histidine kinase n=1 Tax=Synechococcus sp. BDU 130192 TaxID=2042059 RepID=UPI0004AACE59|nr:HAMP domain-containing sensor histidine kinase [Synechococcus sp. BDU 130192]
MVDLKKLEELNIQQTVAGILQDFNPIFSSTSSSGQTGQWRAAIAALTDLLLRSGGETRGVILSSPSPVFDAPQITRHHHHYVLTPKNLQDIALSHLQLPGAGLNQSIRHHNNQIVEFPILPNDPLAQEQFCLILTAKFNFAMALSPQGLLFSFDPEAIAAIWQILQWRMALTQPFQFQTLAQLWPRFAEVVPDYRLVSRFSQLMVRSLTVNLPQADSLPSPEPHQTPEPTAQAQPELELLQALTHEIRTPLTTIRTMTKLLLKKKTQLTQDIVKRIETIEQECNEQIRRMELIFRAAELETPSHHPKQTLQLVPISLEQIFQEGTPRWQKQAQRRNVNLEVALPPYLPQVVSDPAMLDQMLSGLIETLTRRLPTGAEVQIQVSTAGSQLKLEVQSHGLGQKCLEKAIGQLLIFQPETGSLSLNLDVTKNLFQQLGGKLAIRRRASGEEVFAIFLPLGNSFAVPL